MVMETNELKSRCKQFALRVMKLVRAMPSDRVSNPIASQLIRSGTSVAANYRAACLAKSRRDFISKIGTSMEEADESALWMELLIEGEIMPASKVTALHQEATELTAIFHASIKTARLNEQG